MRADGATGLEAIRVDGGMVANDWMLQMLSDILGVAVERPQVAETTALGAAYLAGLNHGLFNDLEAIAGQWQCDKRFEPKMAESEREERYEGWRDAVARVRSSD